MTYCINVHGTSLRVAVTVEDEGQFRARSPDWPGHEGTGSTSDAAVRRLESLLELAADRAVYTARTRDRERFSGDVRPVA